VPLLVRDLAQLVTPAGRAAPLRGQALGEVELITDAYLLCDGDRIAAVGRMRDLGPVRGDVVEIDGRGRCALPGLVDCHTHACFGGDRVEEFSLRARGASYEELHAAGGGILATVRATRALDEAGLRARVERHRGWMLAHGTTTFEAKSGYGLDRETELASLTAIRLAGGVPTWLGAHAVPPEYAGADEYLDFALAEVLPEAARLAEAADVFLERGAFDAAQARRYLAACRDAGLALRLHGDQFTESGAIPLAVELGARSVDHLEATGPAGVAALARSNVTGVLLPASALVLGRPPPPARALVDAGAAIALATDFNPGSAFCERISEITREQLAMTAEEAGRVLDGRSPEAVRALVAQAQGWPALIGLAALSTGSAVPAERVSEGLFRYFADEVFRQEPAEVQQFLLVASVPQTVSAGLARDVLEIEEPEVAIGRLLDEGLLQEAGSGPDELVLHPLLREFLRRKLESELPDLAAALADRVVERARAMGRWEEAFDLTAHRGRLDDAAEIVADASQALLTAGRVETIENWLATCGPVVARHPGALLAKAEVLLRAGKLSEASGLARTVAEGLDADHTLSSRAWCLAGQAAHLRSEDEEALECHLRARELARTNVDLVSALWGAVVVAAELEIPESELYFTEFQQHAPSDVESRLRVGGGTIMLATRQRRMADVSRRVEPLLRLADYAVDTSIAAGFLLQLACIRILRADYLGALELANRAHELCLDVRLAFGEAVCDLTQVRAEIGLRHFRNATRTLVSFQKRAFRIDDPWLRMEWHSLQLRLALAQGKRGQGVAQAGLLSTEQTPRGSRGELIALRGFAAAVSGDSETALRLSTEARAVTQGVEAHYYSRFAELVVDLQDPCSADHAEVGAIALLDDMARDEVYDPFVIAYRAFPKLLKYLASMTTDSHLTGIVVRANDTALAGRAGLDLDYLSHAPEQLQSLTARELEVSGLLADGLSNAEIARALFIAESTAKIHVRHILKKLGVKSRARAIAAMSGIVDEPGRDKEPN